MNDEKKIYDLTVLLKKEDQSLVEKLIKKHSGENLFDIQPFTKVNLAYPIKGENQAFMAAIGFSMEPLAVVEFEHELRTDSQIFRYLLLKKSKTKVVDRKITSPPAGGNKYLSKTGRRVSQDERPGGEKKYKDNKSELFTSNEALERKIKEISE
jgi:ribosomal protein S6